MEAQTPSRLEQIIEAQLGNQILQLAKQAVQIEALQAELAQAKAQTCACQRVEA